MDMKKFKEISTKLKYEALSTCRIFQFVKVVSACECAAEYTDAKLTTTEIGRSIEYSPSDLSRFDPTNLTQKRLIEQLISALDSIAILALKSTQLKATPICFPAFNNDTNVLPNKFHSEVALNTNGVPPTIAMCDLNSVHCQIITDFMKKSPTSYFANTSYYIGLGSPKFINKIQDDSDYLSWSEYLAKGDVLYNGEQGKIGKVRWIEVPNTCHLSNHMRGEGVILGDDGIIVREIAPVELRIINGAVAWCGLIACGLAPNATVIHITSAEEVTHD